MEIVKNQAPPKKTLIELTDEAKENAAVLSQKNEIRSKVEYYKGILSTTNRLINSIDKKIEKLNVGNENGDNEYDIIHFEIEKLEATARLVSQKQFFEMWLKRSKDYSIKFEAISQECNRDFDMILAQVKELATEGSYLEKYIEHYFTNTAKEAEKMSDLDKQSVKNEFFLFMKLERDKANAPKK